MKSPERGIRLDLFIAVCALLISSLAMAASWLQSRETARQTDVLEQQLGAQVWPYLAVSFNLDDGGNTATIDIENDGLGPAVLYSLATTVDGKPKSNFVDVLHVIDGSNLIKRRPHGESMGLHIDNEEVGSVLRPGEPVPLFQFKSKSFAPRFVFASQRIGIRVCYCAIVAGKCWLSDTTGDAPPHPVAACPVIANDILHSTVFPDVRTL